MIRRIITPIIMLGLYVISNTGLAAIDDNPKDRRLILEMINQYRTSKNLEPLQLDTNLSQIAEQHSDSMAMNRVSFGHGGFNKRMTAISTTYPNYKGIAENVAFTGFPLSTVPQLWFDSKGHRINIEGNYNFTGIGIAYDDQGRFYVTQIFLKK